MKSTLVEKFNIPSLFARLVLLIGSLIFRACLSMLFPPVEGSEAMAATFLCALFPDIVPIPAMLLTFIVKHWQLNKSRIDDAASVLCITILIALFVWDVHTLLESGLESASALEQEVTSLTLTIPGLSTFD
jgi:prepilin signal peptidase PulO-like enzyme (type II secretory pathway)